MWKGILLAAGAYIIMLIMAALAAIFLMTLMAPRGCGDMGQALLVLLGTIAALFLASVFAVGVAARKIVPGTAGRFVILAVYGIALLASYVVVAFGLTVAFNC